MVGYLDQEMHVLEDGTTVLLLSAVSEEILSPTLSTAKDRVDPSTPGVVAPPQLSVMGSWN